MSELENEIQQTSAPEPDQPAETPAAESAPVEPGAAPADPAPAEAPAPAVEAGLTPAAKDESQTATQPAPPEARQGAGPKREQREPREPREARDKGPRPPREGAREVSREGGRDAGKSGDRRAPRSSGPPGRDARGPRPDLAADIDLEKLIADSLYLDNQAHAVVSRMRDMDSGTRSQLRRLYSAIRRACRASEADRQHQFVMLRARLAYTIARHQLRSLDGLEKLLLQVTRKNDARGYERFRDLFEAIVAYNE